MNRERTKEQLLEELVKAHRCIRELEEKRAERRMAESILRTQEQLLQQSLKVQEQERRLIGYEIHDGLTQQLTAAEMHFASFDHLREEGSQEARAAFDRGRSLVRQALIESRRLINGLCPAILDGCGIVAAIRHLISESPNSEELLVELVQDLDDQRLPTLLEIAAFRIVQESLTNAQRYSKSDSLRIELTRRGGHLHVVVQDGGVGFDVQTVRDNCFGLAGIRERAKLLGGKATIESTPGEGTRIAVELPMAHSPT